MRKICISPKLFPFFIRKMSIIILFLVISLGFLIFTFIDDDFIFLRDISSLIFALAIFLFIFSIIYSKLICDSHKLYFEENRLVHRWGIIRKNKQTIPSKRITDVFVTTGILDTVLNTSSFMISTAGQDGYLVSMKSVDREEAKDIQKEMEKYISGEEEK